MRHLLIGPVLMLLACGGPAARPDDGDAGVPDAGFNPDASPSACNLGQGPWRTLGDMPIDELVAPGADAQQIAVTARPGLTVAWTALGASLRSEARVAAWDGSTWNALGDPVATPGFAGAPQLARRGDHTAITLLDYHEDTIEHEDLWAFTLEGTSWTSLGPINDQNMPGEYRPRLTVADGGAISVAFSEFNAGSGPGHPLPWSQSLAVGVASENLSVLDLPGSTVHPVGLFTDGAGTRHLVVVAEGQSTTTHVFTDGTQGWSEGTVLPGFAEAATLTPQGQLLVLLRDHQVHRLDGNAWTSVGPALADDFLWADLASDADGQPIVSATSLGGNTWRLRVWHLGGTGWSLLGDPLFEGPLVGAATAIATDACGRPLVAVTTWAQGSTGDVRVYFWGASAPDID